MKYESSITYHSKTMANVQVFADKQTDRPKTVCPQSIDARHENVCKLEMLSMEKTIWYTIIFR